MKVKMVPQWTPTKEQREWLDEKAKTHGTVTGVIRGLISDAMKKVN